MIPLIRESAHEWGAQNLLAAGVQMSVETSNYKSRSLRDDKQEKQKRNTGILHCVQDDDVKRFVSLGRDDVLWVGKSPSRMTSKKNNDNNKNGKRFTSPLIAMMPRWMGHPIFCDWFREQKQGRTNFICTEKESGQASVCWPAFFLCYGACVIGFAVDG
jgi:hypothetical protein